MPVHDRSAQKRYLAIKENAGFLSRRRGGAIDTEPANKSLKNLKGFREVI